MPIREYVCTKCGNCFEKIFKTIKEDQEAKNFIGDACPRCGYIAQRLISRPAPAQFKGSGFYETDYKNK